MGRWTHQSEDMGWDKFDSDRLHQGGSEFVNPSHCYPIQAMADRMANLTQLQPRGGLNWAADGRWVRLPLNWQHPGDENAVLHGWSRGMRVTHRAEWERLRQARAAFLADLPNPEIMPDLWYDFHTVPCMIPMTDAFTGRTVTFVTRTYLRLKDLAFAHYLTRNRRFKRRFGEFDAGRITLTSPDGQVWPMAHPGRVGPSSWTYANRHHGVGLVVHYAPLGPGPDGRSWDTDDDPDSGETSQASLSPPRTRRSSRSRSARRNAWHEAGRPQHRAGERAHSVSP